MLNVAFTLFTKQTNEKEQEDLQCALLDVIFICGTPIQDIHLSGRLDQVYSKQLSCGEPIKIYYSAKYSPICIYCGEEVDSFPNDRYPQCDECLDKPVITKH